MTRQHNVDKQEISGMREAAPVARGRGGGRAVVAALLMCSAVGSAFGQSGSISSVSPNSAPQGTTGLTVSFTLTSPPNLPPSDITPSSITIGTVSGTSLGWDGSVATGAFDIPFSEEIGSKDCTVTFPPPPGQSSDMIWSLSGGFTVTAGADTPPSISSQPQSKTVHAGYAAIFSVTASGSPPLNYQWQKDAIDLEDGTNTSYSISSVGLSDEGNYRCIVTNAYGSITSTVATLTIDTNALIEVDGHVMVDTGQDDCYDANGVIAAPSPGDAYAGQDAQYAGNQPSYALSGDGLTVYDNNTGLTWVRSPDTDGDGDIEADDKLSWTEAQAYPDTLNAVAYGGYTDWRLPHIKEQYSLMDFRGTDPSGYEDTDTSGLIPYIDTNYFDFAYGDTDAGERVIDSQYASSTLYVTNTYNDGGSTLFGVNFADGRIKGYGLVLGPSDKTFFVMCCRGNTNYAVNAFADNGDGTVTDHATGLMWQRADSGAGMNWEEALAYAEGLELGGYRDWRLPNAKELQGILDYTRSPDTTASAAIDPVFGCTTITNEGGALDYPFYWTGTTHVNWTTDPGRAGVYICFGRALGYQDGTWVDVHGAGAQRSDPKYDDGTDYSTGNGPQGDCVRIDNYVRCVRAGADAPTADSDGDGLADWYEYDYASSTTGMVATADDDGDGASNEDEEAAGTIPTEASSVFAITAITSGTSTLTVCWSSALGKTYKIECSTNLLSDAFTTTVASGIKAATPLNVYSNTTENQTTAFYRVVVE